MIAHRQSTLPKVRHTRATVSLSKNGCFTCRARHLKCDEARPRCGRCSRSNRVCAGYQQRTVTLPITTPSKYWISPTNRHEFLARTGIGLLVTGLPTLSKAPLESFGHELLQLGSTFPLVNRCAYTLGMAHELHRRATYDAELEVFAASSHALALRELSKELDTRQHGPLPLVLACVLLAVSEILCERTRSAIFHFRAACDILRQQSKFDYQSNNTLILLLQSIDLHIAVHALSYSPKSKMIWPISVMHDTYDLPSSRIQLMQIRLEALTWSACVLRSQPTSHRESHNLHMIQGQHIARLRSWLQQFNNQILPLCKTQNPANQLSASLALEQALILRMTCLSTLIYISTFLQDHQRGFDAHAPSFQQIVLDAEMILALRSARSNNQGPETPVTTSLVTGCGMNHALSLTAEKYRNTSWRRRAGRCLRQNGFELLFDGARDSLIVDRLLSLEEPSSAPVCSSSTSCASRYGLMRGYKILEDDTALRRRKVNLRLYREKRIPTSMACNCCAGDGDEERGERICQNCDVEVWDEEILY